jgi:hypothetical protein
MTLLPFRLTAAALRSGDRKTLGSSKLLALSAAGYDVSAYCL